MRIAIFVDANNVFYMYKNDIEYSIDYEKILHFLEEKYPEADIIIRRFYTSIPKNPQENQINFIKQIENMGYVPIQRILKGYANGTKKGDTDALIGFDMAYFSANYDLLVLVSGDGDFARNLNLLAREGKKILIMSTTNMLSFELRELSHSNQNIEVISIDDIFYRIRRRKKQQSQNN